MKKIIEDCGEVIEVEVSDHGWPYWTRMTVNGKQVLSVREETARDIAYAFARVVAHLDAMQIKDQNR